MNNPLRSRPIGGPAGSALAIAAAVACATFATAAAGAGAAGAAKLHVPSPDWRDQVIYFVMTDRFADGDQRNNDLGAGEFDPRSGAKFNGGDLRGLRSRLGYIRGLGATALWLTPPVANQWTDPLGGYTGYHGYWAEHFEKVDRHLGSLADYQALSRALHGRGMYLVQDVVVNHTGNFFAYRGGWDAADPARFYVTNAGAKPVSAPTQVPFNLNDPRRAADRRAGIYHWTPDVSDYTDKNQELNYQMSGLDDLNTDNPVVRRALRKSFGHWIQNAGVDAFRIDTAFYVAPEYFVDFLHARDKAAPGIAQVARQTGRRQFHVFGEGFGIDKPFADEQAKKIERYMTGADGRPVLPGMLNFPLYGALGDVFARGRPSAEFGDRIQRMMKLHQRPHLMPTFVDNHDLDRFLAGGSTAALQQALLAIFTLPGIPTIYYGTEQGFTEQRGAMFAAGFASGGRDRFDTAAPLYRQIAQMTALRRAHRLFSRGVPQVLKGNAARAGALAWRMDAGPPGAAESALVVFNTADAETLLDNLDLGLAPRTRLRALFGLDGLPADLTVGANGRVSMKLPPRAGLVWKLNAQRSTAAARPKLRPATQAVAPVTNAAAGTALSIDALASDRHGGDFVIAGSSSAPVQIVIDGDLANPISAAPGADGRWQARIDTAQMVDPETRHEVVAWDASTGTASPARSFYVARAWALLSDVEDPAGDDRGPRGDYVYPTDPGWGANRQMDLRRVQVSGSGGALRLALTTNKISNGWSPQNGFDRVAFTLYIELPPQAGGAQSNPANSSVMPLQFAQLPAGMRWHYRLRVTGWSNALTSAEGASATNEGRLVAPAAQVAVDQARNTVTLTLPPGALGRPATLSGAKVYVTTWDYDGGYRGLSPQPQPYSIGGGDPANDARVMDDSAVIVLP